VSTPNPILQKGNYPFALVEPPPLYNVGLIMATSRTPETLSPFLSYQIPKTIPLGAESPLELMGVYGIIHGPPPRDNVLY